MQTQRPITAVTNGPRRSHPDRTGKVLALFAILLPVLLAIAGLVLDGGGLLNEYRIAQHAVDAAASAAAKSLQDGATEAEAIAVAEQYVQEFNELGAATVTVSIPPVSGPLAGDPQSVEVEVLQPADTHFLAFLGTSSSPAVRTRAVARFEPTTVGAALVVLDPDPPPLSVAGLGAILPPLPSIVGGLEIIGASRVRVDGAVHVNTTWGSVDENGNSAGESAGPPYGIAAVGLPTSEKLRARDIRVAGGVDDPASYGHIIVGDPSPLRANRLPVEDPLIDLPVPTSLADPTNVSSTLWGGVRIADIPLINPPRTLQPGVYEFLQIVSGNVTFAPGIYIIRDVDPITQIALNIIGGQITADGVLFYITNTRTYMPAFAAPDTSDRNVVPARYIVPSVTPSVVIAASIAGSSFRGLDDPGSVFDGMFLFQRRADRRPVVIVNKLLLGSIELDGTIYAKWGHVILSGSGFEQTRVVSGTLRLITVTSTLIAPTNLLPAAEDVFLVE